MTRSTIPRIARPRELAIAIAMMLVCVPALPVQASESFSPDRLRSMSLEELMQVSVVSASRREQKIEDTAAAVHVITRQDLASSKVRTVAEALRMVPGLQVAQIDANRWAVGSRGFTSRYSNKLLVLVDGRSIYSPVFSGVHWAIEDLPLEVIDRIEVIRGPGASVWGSNAVNGVINIITLPAAETRKLGVLVGGGVEENVFGEAWLGRRLGEGVDLRIAAKSYLRDEYHSPTSIPSHDAWQLSRVNARLDWNRSDRTDLSFFADVHDYAGDQTIGLSMTTPPFRDIRQSQITSRGGSVVGRWNHRSSDSRSWSAQSYMEVVEREFEVLGEKRMTWDAEIQLDQDLGERSQLILGGSYRVTDDELSRRDPSFDFGTPARTDEIWSGFAQLDLDLVPNRLQLTLGSKWEDHAYTDPELQPTARVLWHAAQNHTLWGAVSRAVRSPSRAEIEGRYDFGTVFQPGMPPTLVVAQGNPEMKSEELIAWEAGYRFVPERGFSLDVAGFVSDYSHLRGVRVESIEVFSDPAPGYVITNTRMISAVSAVGWGGEITARWQPAERLRLTGFYSYFDLEYGDGGGQGAEVEALYYRHGLSIRSELDVAEAWTLDASFHYHSPIVDHDLSSVERLDMALRWRLQSDLELAVVGQSLLHAHQTEFQSPGWELGTEVERSLFAMVRWSR